MSPEPFREDKLVCLGAQNLNHTLELFQPTENESHVA